MMQKILFFAGMLMKSILFYCIKNTIVKKFSLAVFQLFWKCMGEQTAISLCSQKVDWLFSHYYNTLVPDDRQLSVVCSWLLVIYNMWPDMGKSATLSRVK